MNVIKRLPGLTGETQQMDKTSHEREIANLRRRIDRIMSRRPQRPELSDIPPQRQGFSLKDLISGEETGTSHGPCFVTESLVDNSSYHGDRRIEALSKVNMGAASTLANDTCLKERPLTDGLFLDTETTGLTGGSGTLTFLIGLGWFEKDGFATRQIFIRDFSEERAALSLLGEWVGNKGFLITFNGKSFDVGLLSTRFIMNRLHNPLNDMPHLDLLYPARRLIGHRLDNCRLMTLEERVLGFFRQGDVPGSEIPQRYFDWLKRRDARLVVDVFEHNRLDVISLASLMAHLTELMDAPHDLTQTDHRDLLAAARLLIERGDALKARCLLEGLIGSGQEAAVKEGRKMLSLIHKRAGQWEDAVGLWGQMILDHPGDIFALIELSKWYEHRIYDFEHAMDMVHQALHHASDTAEFERNALVHRFHRLQNRLTPR